MKDSLLDSSEILETLVASGLMDDFMEAVDNDELARIVSILKQAGFSDDVIRGLLLEIEG